MKSSVVVLVLLLVLLSGCYEGRGYAYEHLNNQDPGALRTERPQRAEVSPGNETIGGVYEHLNKNLCGLQPECCGDFSSQDQWYAELQERAAIEQNPELCNNLPDEAFIVDCPGELPYTYYDKTTCLDAARG